MPLTYSSYLKLDELLSMQRPVSDPAEHDETLFIVIHQAYELWFKQMLHETDHLCRLLDKENLGSAAHTLKRLRTIMKLLVNQMDVLETMTPVEFLSFRDRLDSASGFQSSQFRELEFAMGLKQRRVMTPFAEGTPQRAALDARLAAPGLWDSFLQFVERRGYDVPGDLINRDDLTEPITSSDVVQQQLRLIYAKDHELADFCELLTDLDEGVQEWRYRHVKMVERTIGNKKGTGGSSGVDYLKSTLFKPLFPDLWDFRSRVG